MTSDSKNSRDVRKMAADERLNLGWATHLASRFKDELGGVHMALIAGCAKLGHVLICQDSGQNLGMLVSKPVLAADPRIFPIIAAAVPADLHREHIGETMVRALAAGHSLTNDRIIQAICRWDLPSNKFWAAAGFRPIAIRRNGAVRGKPCIVWRRRVGGGVHGVEEIMAPGRLQGGGGRFLPADATHLANWFDQTADGIDAGLRESGAVPLKQAWDDVKLLCPGEIVRPYHPQMRLFADRPGVSALLRP